MFILVLRAAKAQALLLDVGAIAARAKTSFNASQSAIFEEDLVEI